MTLDMNDKRMRRLRRLSDVPRWNATPTLRRQSVAEHTMQVQVIALWLLQFHMILGPNDVWAVLEYCLIHDEAEAVSGDTPSPFKQIVGDEMKAWEHARDYGQPRDSYVRALVKVADCLEAIVFVWEEQAMGNNRLKDVEEDLARKLESIFSAAMWRPRQGGVPWTYADLALAIRMCLDTRRHPQLESL